jgi:hypothetical protein
LLWDRFLSPQDFKVHLAAYGVAISADKRNKIKPLFDGSLVFYIDTEFVMGWEFVFEIAMYDRETERKS